MSDDELTHIKARITALELLCGQLFALQMAAQIGKTDDAEAHVDRAVGLLKELLASNTEHLKTHAGDNFITRTIGETMERVLTGAGNDTRHFIDMLKKLSGDRTLEP